MGILNQLSIVFGLLLGQSLAFPFAKAFTWRYTMVVAIGIAALQFLAGFVVPMTGKSEIASVDSGNLDEEAPLLRALDEQPLSLKGALTSRNKLVRRGCE